MHRQATQPELNVLTIIAMSLATLAWTSTPGLVTPVIAAVLTYLTVTTGAAKALRWDVPHTLHVSNLILRHTAATFIRATAATIQALATATLWLLNTAHTHLTTGYTTAA